MSRTLTLVPLAALFLTVAPSIARSTAPLTAQRHAVGHIAVPGKASPGARETVACQSSSNLLGTLAGKLLAYLSSSAPQPQTPALKIDHRSRTILTAVAAKMKSTRCLSAGFVTTHHGYIATRKRWGKPIASEGYVALSRPNHAFVHYWYIGHDKTTKAPRKDLETFDYADGQFIWSYWDQRNKYYSKDAQTEAPGAAMSHVRVLQTFFEDKPGYAELAGWDDTATSVRYLGVMRWRGVNYRVVGASGKSDYMDDEMVFDTRVFIGSDNLPHRFMTDAKFTKGQYAGSIQDDDIQLNDLLTPASLPATLFAFEPPSGSTEKEQYDFSARSKPLLKTGSVAPPFTVSDRSGKPIKLSDFAGRVVVLDFWATWCGPCQASLPITNRVAQAYAGRNVCVLAVNVWDSKDAFDAWLPQHKQLSAIRFAIDPAKDGKDIATALYGVSGIPTQYVIDPNGNIAWSNVGYDESTAPLETAIDAALKVPFAAAGAPASQAAPLPGTR